MLVGVTMTTASTSGSWIASIGSSDDAVRPGEVAARRRRLGVRVRDDHHAGVGDGRQVPEVGLAHPAGAQDGDADRRGVAQGERHGSSRRAGARGLRWRYRLVVALVRTLSWPLTSADGHVPPALHARHPALGRRRHDDDGQPVAAARRGERGADLVGRAGVDGDRAHRLGVLPEVDRDVVARQPVAVAGRGTGARCRSRAPRGRGEIEDALEAVVVEHDDRDTACPRRPP